MENQQTEIPFYSCSGMIKHQFNSLALQLDKFVKNRDIVNGECARELEQKIKNFTGAEYAISVGNATDALIILLKALGIKEGDEVIVPCFSFFASASCVVHVGATPVFCDIDPITYSIQMAGLEKLITKNTKAIMPVHLFTQMADMHALREFAEYHNIYLIEDSAEAIGMWQDDIHAGLFGSGGVLSFFPTKTLGALGDAGMIITNNRIIADRATSLKKGEIINVEGSLIPGFYSEIDELQAAVLLHKLAFLPQDIARRAYLANYYEKVFNEHLINVKHPQIKRYSYSHNIVYYTYVIETDYRNDLIQHLNAKGIQTEQYYPKPLPFQQCFNYLNYSPGDFPEAEKICDRTIGLPFYPELTLQDIDYVCLVIREFFFLKGMEGKNERLVS